MPTDCHGFSRTYSSVASATSRARRSASSSIELSRSFAWRSDCLGAGAHFLDLLARLARRRAQQRLGIVHDGLEVGQQLVGGDFGVRGILVRAHTLILVASLVPLHLASGGSQGKPRAIPVLALQPRIAWAHWPGVAADEFAAACGAGPGPVLRAYVRTADGPGARHRAVQDRPAFHRPAAVGDVHRFSAVPAACVADPAAQGPGAALGGAADGADTHRPARPPRRAQRSVRGAGRRPAANGAEHRRGPDSEQRVRSDQGSLGAATR